MISESGGLEELEEFLESWLLIRQTLPPALEFWRPSFQVRRPSFQVQRCVADSIVLYQFDRRSLAAGRIIEQMLSFRLNMENVFAKQHGVCIIWDELNSWCLASGYVAWLGRCRRFSKSLN